MFVPFTTNAGTLKAEEVHVHVLTQMFKPCKSLPNTRRGDQLRLWIIKAKQEWEEKHEHKGHRGETNDQEPKPQDVCST